MVESGKSRRQELEEGREDMEQQEVALITTANTSRALLVSGADGGARLLSR